MRRALAILAIIAAGAAGVARADASGLDAARGEGTHVIMRHALAPGTGDPPGFRPDDCSTQRTLSEEGRAQARRAGERLRAAGLSFDLVLASAWCRAAETARLMDMGPVAVEPSLNSFFADRSGGPAATRALVERLRALDGRRALLVTHQVNITALTGVYPRSGEMVVIRLDDDGSVAVEGRIEAP